MISINSHLRSWGRSIGVVIPKEAVIKENLKEGEEIQIIITKKESPLKGLFGIAKGKLNTEEILKELDENGWDD